MRRVKKAVGVTEIDLSNIPQSVIDWIDSEEGIAAISKAIAQSVRDSEKYESEFFRPLTLEEMNRPMAVIHS